MENNHRSLEEIRSGILLKKSRFNDPRGIDVTLDEAGYLLNFFGAEIKSLDMPYIDNCFRQTISWDGILFKLLTTGHAKGYGVFTRVLSPLELK